MIGYKLCWNHLDKDGNVLKEFTNRSCFALITNKNSNFSKGTKYLEYDFHNKQVTDEEARKFFLFVKKIPHLTHLMPKTITPCIKEKKIRFDLTKHNGTQIFTILTILRMVRENEQAVKKILEFNPKKKYNWTPWGILKVCATAYTENTNHSILPGLDKQNVGKIFATEKYWLDKTPAIKTGLCTRVFDTFKFAQDSWTSNWSGASMINDIEKELKGESDEVVKRKPANRNRNNLATAALQVPF